MTGFNFQMHPAGPIWSNHDVVWKNLGGFVLNLPGVMRQNHMSAKMAV